MKKRKMQNNYSKYRTTAHGHGVACGVVLVAGLGLLSATVLRQWFNIGTQSTPESTMYSSRVTERESEITNDEGFHDPLITLVKPIAAYRPETEYVPTIRSTDPVMGDYAARVTLVHFGDFTSAHSRRAAVILQSVVSRNPRVRLVWKNFPNPLSQDARMVALAAYCAQQQGKFWEFHDMLMESMQSEIKYIEEVVRSLELDEIKFEQCLHAPEPIAWVNGGMEDAQQMEVEEFPTLFVGPYRLSGEITEEDVERLVKLIL